MRRTVHWFDLKRGELPHKGWKLPCGLMPSHDKKVDSEPKDVTCAACLRVRKNRQARRDAEFLAEAQMAADTDAQGKTEAPSNEGAASLVEAAVEVASVLQDAGFAVADIVTDWSGGGGDFSGGGASGDF